ncbi:MAG: glycosyltransferase [Gammaproteobacteria bacterium]|nr:glycosyltransferase [Gammaproteobacteria bacterium]
MSSHIDLSIIIPVTERSADDVKALYFEYKKNVENSGKSYEFIYVLDGPLPSVLEQLQALRESGEQIKIIKLAKWFGEATALSVGFENSSGETIVTLPAYQQIDAKDIPRLINALEDKDMVVARRWPRIDSAFNKLQSKVFNSLLRQISDLDANDVGCGARVFRRRVIDEVHIYGDQHRFLAMLAHRSGFKVIQIDVAQSQQDTHQRIYPAGTYLRRLLDFLTIFFLIKFTKKPLRFFGLLGSGIFTVGFLSTLYLIATRVLGDATLADRPALMISVLFIVLGIQVLAIGLVGEIVIFTHAKEIKEYTVEEIIN